MLFTINPQHQQSITITTVKLERSNFFILCKERGSFSYRSKPKNDDIENVLGIRKNKNYGNFNYTYTNNKISNKNTATRNYINPLQTAERGSQINSLIVDRNV